MTQEEYEKVMKENPSKFSSSGENKKNVEGKDSRESSKSNVESDRSGMGWLERFSMMKVGPPRHVKATMGSTDAMGKRFRSREVVS